MNPLKLLFTKRDTGQYELQTEEDENDDVSGLSIFGGLAWVGFTTLYWSGAGLFDSTAGRLGFIPAVIIAWIIGFKTTLFLIGSSIIITISGLLIGWIFDFPFFDTVLEYTAKAYQLLFN
jgi:hypothetical protein